MRWLALVLVFAGCKKGTLGDPKADPDYHGIELPTADPDEQLNGNLAAGTEITLDWAEQPEVACWPATENDNFEGPHVFFEISKEGFGDIFIEVQPESDVDVSIYTIEFSDEVQEPPNVTGSHRCEASYADVTGSNPGQPEAVELQGFPEKTILLGVSGPSTEDTGTFEVNIWRQEGDFDAE